MDGGYNFMEACEISREKMSQINTSVLKILIESKTRMVLIDARTAPWDDGRRIPGAVSITSGLIQDLVPDRESLVVVYCSHRQCSASGKLVRRLFELGYRFVLEYPDGIDGWNAMESR